MTINTADREIEHRAQRLGALDHSGPALDPSSDHPSNKDSTGVLIVGHGSRRAEANLDVREAARRIGEHGTFNLVQAAFLEIEQPNVAEGFSHLVARGASEIIVHPYFLSPGRHTRGDLPREVNEVARRYPSVSYRITEPLSAHPLVIEAAVERIREVDRKALGGNACGGKVYLVGAGPGDPQLLTLRARQLLASCDVVLYDYLVEPEILYMARSAELINVGKIGRGHCTPQCAINQKLIEAAQAGRHVVRLKGGDPFLFGRGGEEAEALYQANIPFEIVPGVSSALAVPAYAGIPLTHRNHSSSVAVLTGAHAGNGACNLRELSNLACADTIIILMGMAHLRQITDQLISSGRDPATPAAVIYRGTRHSQRTVVAKLDSIADQAEQAGMRAPSVIVIGEVVRLRESLSWFNEEAAEEGVFDESSFFECHA